MVSSTPKVPPDGTRALYNMNEANFISRITWLWMTPLLKHGYQEQIQMEDLREIPEVCQCVGMVDGILVCRYGGWHTSV